MSRTMPTRARLTPEYFATLALLRDALSALDELGEGIAAAHLSSVIDLVAARIGETSTARH